MGERMNKDKVLSLSIKSLLSRKDMQVKTVTSMYLVSFWFSIGSKIFSKYVRHKGILIQGIVFSKIVDQFRNGSQDQPLNS